MSCLSHCLNSAESLDVVPPIWNSNKIWGADFFLWFLRVFSLQLYFKKETPAQRFSCAFFLKKTAVQVFLLELRNVFRSITLLKTRLWHKLFAVNFAKILRTRLFLSQVGKFFPRCLLVFIFLIFFLVGNHSMQVWTPTT